MILKILAVITARGGSKRLPQKNMLPLGSKPLVAWSIDAAKKISDICDVLVSTDDLNIASFSIRAGAIVPWLRPSELSTDTASSVDVVLHALDWYEHEKGNVDGVLLLQPTSPFRAAPTIQKGIDLYIRSQYSSVLGVSPTPAHPMWTFKTVNSRLIPYGNDSCLEIRSQDLPPAYIVNGAFYLIRPAELRLKHSFVGENPVPLIIDSPIEALDIDTQWEFELAQYIASKYYD